MNAASSVFGQSAAPVFVAPIPKLLDQLRDAARRAHFDRRVENAYVAGGTPAPQTWRRAEKTMEQLEGLA